MKRALEVMVLLALAGPAAAQTVPEASPAAQVETAYRRTPSFRNDPFRHVFIPHWGFVFSGGATASNNALNASDVGALMLLSDRDSLLLGDAIDAMGLVPRGSGLRGAAQGEGGFYLGGPFGSHFSLGLSARGSGYGSFFVDDEAVALLRDGNGARQDFSLGASRGGSLATAEAGAHAVLRTSALGSADGVRLSLGFGARYIRPAFYARQYSTLDNGGVIRVTGDTIRANLAVAQLLTRDPDLSVKDGASGIASDFLVRMEWPTAGFAFEALVANIGSVTVPLVERSNAKINVNSTSLLDVNEALDTLDFIIEDTASVKVRLPRIVRFSASAWANRILQIDVAASLPVNGEFEAPLAVDVGTTWRFIRTLPLRAGVILGGGQGIGYSGGVAIEGRHMFLQIGAQSLGGFFKKATGTGARVELGFFF